MKLILAFLAILFTPALSYGVDPCPVCKTKSLTPECLEKYNKIYAECDDDYGYRLYDGLFPCGDKTKTLGRSEVPGFMQPKISFDGGDVASGSVTPPTRPPPTEPKIPCGCVTGDVDALIKFEDKCCNGGGYTASGNIVFPMNGCSISSSYYFPVCVIEECSLDDYVDWAVCKTVEYEIFEEKCKEVEFHWIGGECPYSETDRPQLSVTYLPQSPEMKVLTQPARRDIKPANKITKDQGRGGRLGRGSGGY